MKVPLSSLLVFMFGVSVFGQGSLTPTAAPAPTMKSLDQIEARTPISAAPYTISASGSYYLTKNLVVATGDAITINASNVTLDLNGFTISSTQSSAGSGAGISLGNSLRNIAIMNGAISSGVTASGGSYSGTGFGHGINYAGTLPSTTRVTRVSVTGCLMNGINLGFNNSSEVESCNVDTVGSYGISATTVSHSTALNTGVVGVIGENVSDCYATSASYGIEATSAINSYGQSSGSGAGIYSTNANNCWGSSATGSGVQATTAGSCYGTSTAGDGVDATAATSCVGISSTSGKGINCALAVGCFGNSNSGTGINTTVANGCYGFSYYSQGIEALSANNCYGHSALAYGVRGYTSNNCYGEGSIGVVAYGSAVGCVGIGDSEGVAGQTLAFCYGQGQTMTPYYGIDATIANGCEAINSPERVMYKYNMP